MTLLDSLYFERTLIVRASYLHDSESTCVMPCFKKVDRLNWATTSNRAVNGKTVIDIFVFPNERKYDLLIDVSLNLLTKMKIQWFLYWDDLVYPYVT